MRERCAVDGYLESGRRRGQAEVSAMAGQLWYPTKQYGRFEQFGLVARTGREESVGAPSLLAAGMAYLVRACSDNSRF